MTAASLKQLLQTLTRDRLLWLCDRHGVARGPGYCKKLTLVQSLLATRAFATRSLLADLRRKDLVRAAGQLGLACSGTKQELTTRIETRLRRPNLTQITEADGWRPFEQARAFARSLGLLGMVEWHAYCRGELAVAVGTRPADIPASPHRVYGLEWTDYRDWVGDHDTPVDPRYLPFTHARRFAWDLGLRTRAGWIAFCKGKRSALGSLPGNVPSDPELAYPKAWRGWQDWLGTKQSGPSSSKWRSFVDARAFAQALGLKSVKEWRAYCRGEREDLATMPLDVPSTPDNVYRALGWKGYGDWLGTGNVRERAFRPFVEARAFAQDLGLSGEREWREYCRGSLAGQAPRPNTIPSNPQRVYRDEGWEGYGDWLGTGNVSKRDLVFCSFGEARRYARGLQFKTHLEWRRFCAGRDPGRGGLRAGVPACPDRVYPQWTSWGDFLGTGAVSAQKRTWRSFEAARALARSLKLRDVYAWRAYCKGDLEESRGALPDDVPANPDAVYEGQGWAGFTDWLGNTRQFPSYQEAQQIAQLLGITSSTEWVALCRGQLWGLCARPDLPRSPNAVYQADWTSWGEFLGTGYVACQRREYRAFAKARAFVRDLGLQRAKDYFAMSQAGGLPEDLPAAPDAVYAGQGWVCWGDWLGTGRRARRRAFRGFAAARSFVRRLGLETATEWREWAAGRRPDLPPRPADIPFSPKVAYGSKWLSWRDWLNG